MFSKNIKSIMIIAILLVMLLGSVVLYADCDMMALIAKKGIYISDIEGSNSGWALPNDPHDYFDFLYDFSPSNPDGYGIIYFDSNGDIPAISYPATIGTATDHIDPNGQAWYVITNDLDDDSITIENHPDPYNDAKSEILESGNDVGIVLGHVRNATSSIGNHPFQIIYDTNGDEVDETYMFMHNGNVTDMLSTFRTEILDIDNQWFDENPSNWFGNSQSSDDWIDSEMYFHYIMAHIKQAGGNIMKGIYNALSNLANCSSLGKSLNEGFLDQDVNANFVLSDGENLYLYRNCNDDDYRLAYNEHDSGFFGVQTNNSNSQFTLLPQNSFVLISQYGDPVVMTDFLIEDSVHTGTTPQDEFNRAAYQYNFISGVIDNNTTDLNIHYYRTYISGDTYIESGHTLELESETVNSYTFYPRLKFAGHQNLYIEGTVNIDEGAHLILTNSALVEISASGLLFLDWGTTITGFSSGYYVGEDYIHGDRIIAQNGGVISTKTKTQYQNDPGDVITISSSSDELWDGIYIETPSGGDTYWFVNCDISGISNLSIENGPFGTGIASLKLYETDFHNAGQILTRHGHNLSIEGVDEENKCNISNNYDTPIVAYDSPVFIEFALIEENGYDENTGELVNPNCDGVFLNYATNIDTQIRNTIMQENSGCGIQTYCSNVDIQYCTIQNNDKHGLITKIGTFNDMHNITILNNNFTEYVGAQDSYNWEGKENIIQDTDGFTHNDDQYILYAYQWDGFEHSIDVRGNDINHIDNEEHFFPRYEAFRFDQDEIPLERQMLYSALDEMNSGNYNESEAIFQQLISTYPNSNEAATSIRGLLLLESLTDADYASLRSYIDNIQVSEETSLYKAKEDVKTKSYMKDKEFLIAIERLEDVINNSDVQDEILMAMIDEGYCYLELAQSGDRALPVNCTIRTKTFQQYQDKVRELESQFSFNPELQEEEIAPIAGDILSLSNYPNPFNPITTIAFDLSTNSLVSIEVYNIKGQKVKQLISDQLNEGHHTVVWNGTDKSNKSVASGLYFYKLTSDDETVMRKMLLLK